MIAGIERLPRAVTLDWVGPTIFVADEPAPLASFDRALASHAHAASVVIGTTRENDRTVLALFCVEPATGLVFVVDRDAPHTTRFVNGTVTQLALSWDVLVSSWPLTEDASFARVSKRLGAIDAAAIDEDTFWSTFLASLDAL